MQLTRPTRAKAAARCRRGVSGGRLARLRADASGAALVEFAIALPVFLVLGMYGTELAYMASVDMEVSQMANSVADNASRLGQTDNSSVTPTVTETDVDSVMDGALRQGSGINFQSKGRIILSSLEKDSSTGKQYIHWQRCAGDFDKSSAYGDDGANNGLNGTTLAGMGKSGHAITAPSGSAVMYAEVYYHYSGLFGSMFVKNMVFKQEAAFIVRDDRNLTPGVTGTGGHSACT